MGSGFRSKETSWLSFNARVLQEAADPGVPLFERLKFLGIYSSNLDEFFRVRVATLKRLALLGEKWKELGIPDPNETLHEVNRLVVEQACEFNTAYDRAVEGLRDLGIRLVDETAVPSSLRSWLRDYFRREVGPHVFPIVLKATSKLPKLKDLPMYLAVRLSKSEGRGRPLHALIEIPPNLPRFITLPKQGKTQLVMYLDDVIRYGLDDIFAHFPFDRYESYAIKFTRDAELEFDDDFTESYYEKLAESLRAREDGPPVRANFDERFPPAFLRLILQKLKLENSDSLYPGARYHNRRDLLRFPRCGVEAGVYERPEPVPLKGLRKPKSGILPAIRKRDVLLHTPYHPFRHLIEFLQEVSLDSYVRSIRMTHYRLAANSCVARALQTAARNGKEVMVLVEPQARFDEEANIRWANRYRDAGVRVVLGVPGLKVHSKLLLVTRREGGRERTYTGLGTGNFNEETATVFADHLLLTYHQEIGEDVARIFRFFEKSWQPPKLRHLVAAPFGLRTMLRERIEREIEHHRAGREAGVSLKVNNLSDPETVDLINRAAQEGVPVRLIVRSMFSLVIDKKSRVEAIGIVDKYLEHSRMLLFENGGEREAWLSSADFLPRNFDSRIETVFPVYDKKLRKQLLEYFAIQWRDNTKARLLEGELGNAYREREKDEEPCRAQEAIEEYLRGL